MITPPQTPSKSLLILTVGTGTQGQHSNLAQGIVNTLSQIQPRLFWLVPSASPDSVALAEIVRDGAPPGCAFQPWNVAQPFCQIVHHDDLFECRTTLREVIRAARQQLRLGERLLVNPTSGTKQMSVAATLAALDEEIGEIVFTVGERADGVVKTGTERIASFSTRQFFLERDFRIAEELFAAGAFFAAARVLKNYSEPKAAHARETALCLHEWQRMNHTKAASHAAKFSQELAAYLKRLADADEFSLSRLRDLLDSADELARWGDHEEALARYYRTAEQAAKVRLAQNYELRPPYQLNAILKLLPKDSSIADEFQKRARNGKVLLTAQAAWDLLKETGDQMAAAYYDDRSLQKGLMKRNETMYGHGEAVIDANQTRVVAKGLHKLLCRHLFAAEKSRKTFPRPRTLSSSATC
jgi:flagellar motility protein MotE (MotC chaperone)